MANDRKVGNLVVQMRAELGQLHLDVKEMERTFNTGFKSIQRVASQFGSALVGALSIGALIGFGRELLNLGDKLSDLSDQTGNSVAVLGGLRTIAEQNGSSVDAFAKGMLKAQRSLGEMNAEGEGAAKSMRLLGLNVNELKQLSPDAFLEKFSKALGTVENRNERAAIAVQLFGKAGAELVPTLLQIAEKGLPKLSAAAEEGFKQLGFLKDEITELTGRFANFAAELVKGFDVIFNVSELQKLKTAMVAVADEIEAIDKRLERRQSLRAKGFGFFTVPESADIEEQKKRLDAIQRLADLGAEIGKKNEIKPQGNKLLGIGTADARKEIDDFIAALQKQATTLQISMAGLLQGEQAAKSLAIAYEMAAFKAKLLAENKPVPVDLRSLDVINPQLDAVTGRFRTMADQVLALNADLEKTKLILEQSFTAKRFAEEEAENTLVMEEQKRARDELNKATLEGIAIARQVPPDLQKQLAENIEARLTKDIAQVEILRAVLGETFDATAAKVSLTSAALQQLAQTVDPASAALTKMGDTLKTLEAAKAGEDFRKTLDLIDAQARVFGADFDSVGAKMSALRAEIERLLAKPQDQGVLESIDNLKARFDTLKNTQDIANAYRQLADSIGNAFDDSLRGIVQGTQTFGDAMKNLFRNIVVSIANEINKLAVINPFKNWLNELIGGGGKQLPTLGGLGGLFGGLFGGASADAGAVGFFGEGASFAEQGLGAIGSALFLAQGGVVKKPTIAVVGEAGPEAIIPLKSDGLHFDLTDINPDVKAMLSKMAPAGGDGRGESPRGIFFAPPGGVPPFAKGGLVDRVIVSPPGLREHFAAISSFADGGLIKAHADEFVTKRDSVKSVGVPAMEFINKTGTLPGKAMPTRTSTGNNLAVQNVYNIDARGAQRGVSDEIKRAIAMSENKAVKRSVGAVRDERLRSSNFASAFGK